MFPLFRKNFSYRPLDTASDEIRLIRVLPELKRGHVQCQVEHFPSEQAPPYIALSYTWQNPIPDERDGPTDDGELIRVNQNTLRIGSNLASALQYLRRHQPLEYAWVDAISIDQANVEERGHQVLRMVRIYGAAQRTIVWLGHEAGDSDLALDFMRFLARKFNHFKPDLKQTSLLRRYLRDKMHLKSWTALGRLLKRTWWTRMWIVQEMVVSRNIDVICGDSLISWLEIANSMSFIVYSYDSITSMFDSNNIILDFTPLRNVSCIKELRKRLRSGSSLVLEVCLSLADGYVASDDRDYIYAILALASDASALVPRPDYTMTTHDVYHNLARSYIEHHKSLDIIHLRPRPIASSPLPSWVPHWKVPRTSERWKNSLFVRDDKSEGLVQCAAASTVPLVSFSPDLKVLTCRGFSIDVVDGCPLTLWEASADRGRVLQPLYRNCAYASSKEAFSAIWRSLVQDVIFHNNRWMEPPEDCGRLFANSCRRYDSSFDRIRIQQIEESEETLNERRSNWYKKTKDFAICGRTLHDWIFDHTEDLYFPTEAGIEMRHSFYQAWDRTSLKPRIITTEKGYVGRAPRWVQRGDKVCILLGSSLPVLLRPVDDHYRLVGPCYIHGIMFGEAMGLLDKGEVEMEDFALH